MIYEVLEFCINAECACVPTQLIFLAGNEGRMAAPTVKDFMNNEKWVARIKMGFDMIDINKNGTVEEEDWTRWIENIKRDVNPDAALLDKLKKAMGDYTAAVGVTSGKKLNKDEYVKAMAEMAAAETARKAKGEKTLGNFVNDAWHDVVDKNHDGFITLDEFRTVMKACNATQEMADARFNAIDKDKNGKVERKELREAEEKFWYGLD